MSYVIVAAIFFVLGILATLATGIVANRKNPEAVDKAEAAVRDLGK
jgi:hypothetical protein